MDDDLPYDISVSLEAPCPVGAESCVVGAVEATLVRNKALSARVSVAVVDDADMTQLNKRHLDRDEPTDVLAFDLRGETSAPAHSACEIVVDGDVVVSIETAQREADRRGHPVDAELALYAVHGTLHLLGHNDRVAEEAARMHEIEDEILTDLGFGRVFETP